MPRKSKVREGLHVLSRAEQSQDGALVFQVGRIVVTQFDMENVLSLVFFKVCGSSFAKPQRYFYSVYGFDNRKGRKLPTVDLKRSADDLVRIHGLLTDFRAS